MCIFSAIYTHSAMDVMRTNIDIDAELMTRAMDACGLATKKATVEEALRKLIILHEQQRAIQDMKGLGWEGDLDEMRRDWTPDVDWAFKDDRK